MSFTTQHEVAKAGLGRAKTCNIIALLAVAMLLSSGASIAGGVIMYFESLSSLKDSVGETSLAELRGLTDSIRQGTYDKGLLYNGQQVGMSFSNRLLTNDTATWDEAQLQMSLGMLRADESFYGGGFVFIPRNRTATEDWHYIAHWATPLTTGDIQFIQSKTNDDNASMWQDPTTGAWNWELQAWVMNKTTATVVPQANEASKYGEQYTWNAGFYVEMNFDEGDNYAPPTPAEQEASFFNIHRIRKRPKTYFQKSDPRTADSMTTYSGWDILYHAPPPPHPWSRFKYVLSVTWFRYLQVRDIMAAYASSNADSGTAVISFNRFSHQIQATSWVDETDPNRDCWNPESGSRDGLQVCSAPVQAVVREMNATAWAANVTEHFSIVADGAYFARWSEPVGLEKGTCFVWLRPTASVQHKVAAALTLLILFSAGVVLFDLLIFAMEIALVGVPLRDLSHAVEAVGDMDTQMALNRLDAQCRSRVHVAEVHRVLDGMVDTLANLERFKMFLPASTVAAAPLEAAQLAPAPTGRVAIVFSDVVGSSRLWEDVPGAMPDALDQHWAVLRGGLAAHGGYEVKTIGDALMASFQNPYDAFLFASEAQVALTKVAWGEELCVYGNTARVESDTGQTVFHGLQVRIGMHYGDVATELNPVTGRMDYRAAAVNQAARIEAAALPGMVAFSEEVKEALQRRGVAAECLGAHDLRGIGSATLYYATHQALSGRAALYARLLGKDGGTRRPCGRDALPTLIASLQWSTTLRDEHEFFKSPEDPPLLVDAPTLDVDPPSALRPRRARLARDMRRARSGAVVFMEVTLPEEGCPAATPARDDSDSVGSAPSSMSTGSFISKAKPSDSLLMLTNRWLQRTGEMCSMTGGTLESVTGGLAVVSWGLTTADTQATRQCLRFVGATARAAALAVLRPRFGAACGPFLHGNVGSSHRRFHNVFGAGLAYARGLLNMCGAYRAEALAMRAGGMPRDLAQCLLPVDVFTLPVGVYGPYCIVEALDLQACAQLRPVWEGDEDAQASSPLHNNPLEARRATLTSAAPRASSSTPTERLRAALTTAAARKTRIAGPCPEGLPPRLSAVYDAAAAQGDGFVSKPFPGTAAHAAPLGGTPATSSPAASVVSVLSLA